MRVAVVALGDLGRSPRIQLHVKCLAAAGCSVDFIGFGDTPCWLLDDMSRIRIRLIDPATGGSRLRRGFRLATGLSRELAAIERPDVVLVQTPPAVPALYQASTFARRAGARVVFDWHNLGYSLMALRAGAASPWVALYRFAEARAARRGDAHLCVSEGLRGELRSRFGVGAEVFEDRPAGAFRPAGDRAAVRRELLAQAGLEGFDGLVAISPTSWTADEEFGLLEDAADHLDRQPGRPLAWIVSGRGELRAAFEARVTARSRGRVRFATTWLNGGDYARLLSGADVGLSLHASSSGVDFPMKIHDLRGAGLPVLARDFPGLSPQFVDGRDGLRFRTARDLAELFARLADDPSRLAEAASGRPGVTWEEEWERRARAVILGR